jgi:hypothetical protein
MVIGREIQSKKIYLRRKNVEKHVNGSVSAHVSHIVGASVGRNVAIIIRDNLLRTLKHKYDNR